MFHDNSLTRVDKTLTLLELKVKRFVGKRLIAYMLSDRDRNRPTSIGRDIPTFIFLHAHTNASHTHTCVCVYVCRNLQ